MLKKNKKYKKRNQTNVSQHRICHFTCFHDKRSGYYQPLWYTQYAVQGFQSYTMYASVFNFQFLLSKVRALSVSLCVAAGTHLLLQTALFLTLFYPCPYFSPRRGCAVVMILCIDQQGRRIPIMTRIAVVQKPSFKISGYSPLVIDRIIIRLHCSSKHENK